MREKKQSEMQAITTLMWCLLILEVVLS